MKKGRWVGEDEVRQESDILSDLVAKTVSRIRKTDQGSITLVFSNGTEINFAGVDILPFPPATITEDE